MPDSETKAGPVSPGSLYEEILFWAEQLRLQYTFLFDLEPMILGIVRMLEELGSQEIIITTELRLEYWFTLTKRYLRSQPESTSKTLEKLEGDSRQDNYPTVTVEDFYDKVKTVYNILYHGYQVENASILFPRIRNLKRAHDTMHKVNLSGCPLAENVYLAQCPLH